MLLFSSQHVLTAPPEEGGTQEGRRWRKEGRRSQEGYQGSCREEGRQAKGQCQQAAQSCSNCRKSTAARSLSSVQANFTTRLQQLHLNHSS